MTPLVGFGFAQEDDRTDARVLRPARGRRLLCVASGGEVPLGMAARGATVDAVDTEITQLHLVALKHAVALTLDPEDACLFLGYTRVKAARGERRMALYPTVRRSLAPETGGYWDTYASVIQQGASWAGRFEQYLSGLMRVLRPAWGRAAIEALCGATTLAEQEAVFDARIG